MNKIIYLIKSLIIIGISIIYLYFGRFITIAIGMFFLVLQWDDANICLSFVTYIEQLLIIAMLVWYIFKEMDIIKWGIVAFLGILILYLTVISVHFNSIPIVEQMKNYFYDRNINIDYIVLQIISLYLYIILPSSYMKIRRR